MESFLRASSSTNLFVDDDQCIDYFFGLAQEAPLSPDPWVVAPAPGMSVDHHFGSLVSLDDEFTPPATEPASPIHDGFPRGDVKVDAMVGSADLLDLFDSTLSTAPSSPIGDCMLTPAASSLATPLASPQIHGCQPNRFFPTFFLGGGADSTDMIFQGGSPVSLATATTPERLYSTDSEEEEIDVESVVDAKTRGMVPKEANKARVAPSASRRRRSVAGSETSPARKARRGSTVRAAMAAAAANAVMAAATASTTSSDESMDEDSAGAVDDELKKRNVHNILERKRREDLKFSFQMLRERVPDIAHDERAPKVVILKQATGHIHILKARQLDIQAEKEKLLHQQRTLQERLRQLQYH